MQLSETEVNTHLFRIIKKYHNVVAKLEMQQALEKSNYALHSNPTGNLHLIQPAEASGTVAGTRSGSSTTVAKSDLPVLYLLILYPSNHIHLSLTNPTDQPSNELPSKGHQFLAGYLRCACGLFLSDIE